MLNTDSHISEAPPEPGCMHKALSNPRRRYRLGCSTTCRRPSGIQVYFRKPPPLRRGATGTTEAILRTFGGPILRSKGTIKLIRKHPNAPICDEHKSMQNCRVLRSRGSFACIITYRGTKPNSSTHLQLPEVASEGKSFLNTSLND